MSKLIRDQKMKEIELINRDMYYKNVVPCSTVKSAFSNSMLLCQQKKIDITCNLI